MQKISWPDSKPRLPFVSILKKQNIMLQKDSHVLVILCHGFSSTRVPQWLHFYLSPHTSGCAPHIQGHHLPPVISVLNISVATGCYHIKRDSTTIHNMWEKWRAVPQYINQLKKHTTNISKLMLLIHIYKIWEKWETVPHISIQKQNNSEWKCDEIHDANT